ncbi:hypothetical protein QEN19_003455 [Hanseniaspora menglaensis]
MTLSENLEDFELYLKLARFSEDNDVVNGQYLMDLYNVIDTNNKNNNKVAILNNVILSTIVAYYYDDVENPEVIIQLINKILPVDEVDDLNKEAITSQIWLILLRLVTKGLIKEATIILNNYINENEAIEHVDDYKILLDILLNYPLSNLHDLKLFKNWKKLTSEFYSYISSKSETFDIEFVLLVGVLNGNEKDISRINNVLNLNSLNWGRLFLSFFLFYIPTMQLLEEYLVKSLNYCNFENEKNSIYQDFLIKDTSRIISYVPILIDLDDVLGLTFIETLNKLNIITLDAEFINLIYDNWLTTFTENKSSMPVDEISVYLKLIIQSSLSLGKKRLFIDQLLDNILLKNQETLKHLTNNEVEYLIGILSGLRMPQTCKRLYKELGLCLLENVSLNGENEKQIDSSSFINGLSILTKGLEYYVSTEDNENDVLTIIIEKLDIILESNFKRFISSDLKTENKDVFADLIGDYENFNPILKQAFVALKVIKELEKMLKETKEMDYHKYLTYIIELLKFEPLKDKLKMILLVYYLSPVLSESRASNANNFITNSTTYFNLMNEVNKLMSVYESNNVVQDFIEDLVASYPPNEQSSIQDTLKTLIELSVMN